MAKENIKKEEYAAKNVKVLVAEDFDNNPELTKAGLSIGDEVEIPTHKTVEVTADENDQLLVEMAQVALEENEKVRIVISEKAGGSLIIHTKVAEGIEMKPSEMVGLLEVSTFDILSQQTKRGGQSQGQAPELTPYDAEMVNHTLTEEDFISVPELKDDMGKKAGDVVKLPRIAVNGLIEARKK